MNRPQGTATVEDFPAGYTGYHTYAETQTELQKAVANYPSLTKLGSAGTSYEGRALSLIKISDNAATDENEPEVLFTCNQHAREHLTTEMCLHIVQRLTSGYATDPAIKRLVDSTEIWVIPSVNPDGSEYDISGGTFHSWRKNRQGPAPTPTATGATSGAAAAVRRARRPARPTAARRRSPRPRPGPSRTG